MPTVTQDEFEQLVIAGQIVGFTLDTTEFFHVGYNYQAPSFKALGQFVGRATDVIFSEVVLGEVHDDVRDDIQKKADLVRTGLNQVSKAAGLGFNVEKLITDIGMPDPSNRAQELLDAFVDRIKAVLVAADDGPTVRKLTDLYFGSQPPFSKKAEKKNEFPDAIALLSLEHWAAQKGGLVLAVSGDGDWKRFAADSKHLVCVSQLTAALDLFNRIDAAVAKRIATGLTNRTAGQLIGRIDSLLESAVEIFEVDATAPYYFEVDDEYATINSWSVDGARFDVLGSDSESVTIAFNVSVKAIFHASFSFTVRDGIDKDYIGIGGAEALKEESFDLQVVVTVGRDDEGPDPDILEIDSEGPSISVDFGYLEVDYGDDHDS